MMKGAPYLEKAGEHTGIGKGRFYLTQGKISRQLSLKPLVKPDAAWSLPLFVGGADYLVKRIREIMKEDKENEVDKALAVPVRDEPSGHQLFLAEGDLPVRPRYQFVNVGAEWPNCRPFVLARVSCDIGIPQSTPFQFEPFRSEMIAVNQPRDCIDKAMIFRIKQSFRHN